MKFGLMLPNKGRSYGDANVLVELAFSAEQAGWEGFFLWDHIGGSGDSPTVDPWICLGAIAGQTQTMRLGTMVTPLARRRPCSPTMGEVSRHISPYPSDVAAPLTSRPRIAVHQYVAASAGWRGLHGNGTKNSIDGHSEEKHVS